jgi:formamidopyrimidine-DNA glycosylase
MPELPEVETVARTLDPLLSGRTIVRVRLGSYQRCIATPAPDQFSSRIAGQTIEQVDRRAKFILLRLSSADVVTIHLRMTGDLSIQPPETPAGPHLHLSLDLDNDQQLRYHDIRKFGRWSLLTPEQFALFDQSLGPEPLDDDLDECRFRQMLHSRHRIIKPLLLDQSFIAGIGNIYADEALFRAGVHPRRRSHELTPAEIERLLRAIREVLREALENRGATLRNYRDGSGQPGENLSRLRIYARAEGDPCPVCGTPIVREVIGQRGTKLCPTCQPLEPVQPDPVS